MHRSTFTPATFDHLQVPPGADVNAHTYLSKLKVDGEVRVLNAVDDMGLFFLHVQTKYTSISHTNFSSPHRPTPSWKLTLVPSPFVAASIGSVESVYTIHSPPPPLRGSTSNEEEPVVTTAQVPVSSVSYDTGFFEAVESSAAVWTSPATESCSHQTMCAQLKIPLLLPNRNHTFAVPAYRILCVDQLPQGSHRPLLVVLCTRIGPQRWNLCGTWANWDPRSAWLRSKPPSCQPIDAVNTATPALWSSHWCNTIFCSAQLETAVPNNHGEVTLSSRWIALFKRRGGANGLFGSKSSIFIPQEIQFDPGLMASISSLGSFILLCALLKALPQSFLPHSLHCTNLCEATTTNLRVISMLLEPWPSSILFRFQEHSSGDSALSTRLNEHLSVEALVHTARHSHKNTQINDNCDHEDGAQDREYNTSGLWCSVECGRSP